MNNTKTIKDIKFWNSFAKKYDKAIDKAKSEAYNSLHKKLAEDTKHTWHLLELATGTGLLSIELSKSLKNITASDLSPEMIKIAKSKAKKLEIKNINFTVEDICNLSFKDNSFDTILASNVLHLLPNPEKAMSEISRVLKPGGTIITPTFCHGNNFKSQFFSRLMSLYKGFKARSRWSVSSFAGFIKKSGFNITKTDIYKDSIPMVYLVAEKKAQ